MANYAIGDIQGCYKEFKLALKKVNFNLDEDYLWLVGDLINRGPDSLKLLKHIYKIKERTHIVLGNHDLHFLACFYGQRKLAKADTISKLMQSKKSLKYAKFLMEQPLIFKKEIVFKNKSKKVIMVHAGIPPNLSLENCFDLNKEFQIALKKNPKRILKKIFNNPFSKFSKKMSRIDRIIFFANALTRIRACNDKGKIDFNFKGINTKEIVSERKKAWYQRRKAERQAQSEIPKKLNAWFNYENSIIGENSQLIFGHWAAIKGKTKKKDIFGLDTGCVWGDKLTIMRLEDNKRFQIDRIKK